MDIFTSTPGNSDAGGPFITLRNTALAHLLVPLTYKEHNGYQEGYSGFI